MLNYTIAFSLYLFNIKYINNGYVYKSMPKSSVIVRRTNSCSSPRSGSEYVRRGIIYNDILNYRFRHQKCHDFNFDSSNEYVLMSKINM